MNLAKRSAANILFFIVGLERVSEKPQEGDLGQFLKSIWDNGDSEHPVLTPTSQQAAPRSPLQGTPVASKETLVNPEAGAIENLKVYLSSTRVFFKGSV